MWQHKIPVVDSNEGFYIESPMAYIIQKQPTPLPDIPPGSQHDTVSRKQFLDVVTYGVGFGRRLYVRPGERLVLYIENEQLITRVEEIPSLET